MSRSLLFFDTGELALAGAQFGLGHPPGQPIYTLILGGLSALFGEYRLVAMNAFSAFSAALCAFPAHRLMCLLGASQPWVRFGCLMAVGLSFPVWEQGTRIELYGASTLIMLWIAAIGCRAILIRELAPRRWLCLGALVGLGIGFNPVLAAAAGLGVGLAAIPRLMENRWFTPLTAAGTAAVGSLGGLGLSTAYIIWSGGQTDGFIWGHPTSWDTFWFYVSGADYAHTEHAAWSKFSTHLSDWLAWLTQYGASPLVLLGLGGLVGVRTLRARWPVWALPCFVGAAFTFTYGIYFPDVPDFNGYLMALVWWCGIGCACVCSATRVTTIGLVTTCALSGAVFVGTWLSHAPDRSDNRLAVDLAKTWLDQMPKNGLLLAETDHLVFPLMYLQSVERYRTDVVVINIGFSASGWYWDDLYRTHPDLTRIPIRPQPRHERLRAFLLHNRQRPTYVENIEIAGAVGIRPCVTTWGLALGQHCAQVADNPSGFAKTLDEWWSGAPAHDHVSRRVLASLGAARATALLALGQPKQALKALRAGMPSQMRQDLVMPAALESSIRQWPLPPVQLLIGTADHNLNLGRSLLVAHGYRGVDAWLPKTVRPLNPRQDSP